ncbi:hypothetical protein [Candidatus Hecatella orcuttiae]|jgi:hypothetical protein|uniref:hypothetical protein n=1 Tax=Candidatus Hecatella orcuttiae TaxID=1935119 RepID=UPI0028682D59|nr:hypothetical protein [Candidatus Hecatella orcuttiae]
MAEKFGQVVVPYYCKLALLLCQQARELLYSGLDLQSASKLCSFISTLCVKNGCSICKEESQLCSKVSETCVLEGGEREAKNLCDVARRLCPKGFSIHGS